MGDMADSSHDMANMVTFVCDMAPVTLGDMASVTLTLYIESCHSYK